jgi:copper oxidase (laccase) domain-containing protein
MCHSEISVGEWNVRNIQRTEQSRTSQSPELSLNSEPTWHDDRDRVTENKQQNAERDALSLVVICAGQENNPID